MLRNFNRNKMVEGKFKFRHRSARGQYLSPLLSCATDCVRELELLVFPGACPLNGA